jgi:hypothetical protein
MHAR